MKSLAHICVVSDGRQYRLYSVAMGCKSPVGRRMERNRPMPEWKEVYDSKEDAEKDAARINQYINNCNESARRRSRQERDQDRLDRYISEHSSA